MRACHTAILAVVLPALLQAQTKSSQEPYLLFPPGVAARIETYTEMDPANLMQIRGLAADSVGFLWCYTNEGMARFDGYELNLYRESLSDTGGKERTRTQAIEVDGDGIVWMATYLAGLKRLDPATGQSRWYLPWEKDLEYMGKVMTELIVTSDGELWVGGGFGLAMYDRRSDSFIRYALPSGYRLAPTFRNAGLCQIGRSIWAALRANGVAEFNRGNKSWRVFKHNASVLSGPSNDTVNAVYGGSRGILWVGTAAGLDRYEPATDSWRHISATAGSPVQFSRRPVTSITEDDFGGIWFAALGDGIFRFDPTTGNFSQYRHDSADPNSLRFNDVMRLQTLRFKRRSESLPAQAPPGSSIVWILYGSRDVSRVIVRKDPSTRVVIRSNEGEGQPAVCALWHDTPEEIWAGTYLNRIRRFNLRTGKVHVYPDPAMVWRLGRLRDGTVVGVGPGKAWKLDAKRDVFVPFVPDLMVYAFLETRDGTLWLGCSSRRSNVTFLAAVDRNTGAYTIYPRHDPDSSGVPEGIVVRMCEDGKGVLWYGTFDGGVVRFDLAQKTYRRYAGNPGSTNGLVANSVTAVVPDSGGTLWVGTHAGLDLMDCDRGTFQHMRSPHPINELFIRNMVDDGEGHLWIAAEQIAVCFSKATRTFRMLAVPEQFRSKPLWEVSYVPQTRMVTFAGIGGFFMFSIDSLRAPSPPPPVVFTSFKVFEKPYPLDAEVWSLKSITLPHSASFFSFTFSALDYVNPTKNQYSYRLEGADPDWVQSGSRRYVSYTNLDPGKYLLRVKGTNNEGTWNEGGASIEIIVQPPWYRTYWAYGAYLFIAGCLLYLLYGFDRRRTALKHSLEMKSFEAVKMHEVDQMKSRFFANISHEFRTPLTLILGPIDQLKAQFKDQEAQLTLATMRRNGLRLLQLINQLLDLSKMDAGKMSIQARPLDLVAIARPLVMSFLSLAERKRIQLIFDPEEDEIIAYADRDKIEKILTNLLSNAFKFTGEGGEVKVILRFVDAEKGEQVRSGARGRRVELIVSDTGIGIAAENLGKIFDRFFQGDPSQNQDQGGTGIGLALTKELVEFHKGEITVQSTPGHGSTFIVHLPVGKAQWSPSEIVTDELIEGPIDSHDSTAMIPEAEAFGATETDEEPGKSVVLIVEDNADVRAYIRGLLHENYRIIEAADGKEALVIAGETALDLVISDIMMPVMDGVELCRSLKGDDRTNHIPVILLTARATEEGKLEGLDSGADDYIVKPFDAKELVVRVKNLIELRRKLREKYGREVTLGPSKIPVVTTDERFLNKLTQTIEQHMNDAGYGTELLAHDMCMSRMQLNRKLHALTGHSTHELVREFRLQRAAELLRTHADNVSGVAFQVGFNNLSHFARAFRDRFGVPPSEYETNHPAQSGEVKIHPHNV